MIQFCLCRFLSWHQVVNFNHISTKLNISLEGFNQNSVRLVRQTVLSSNDLDGDNTIDNPTKVIPQITIFKGEQKDISEVEVVPYSFTSFDLTH
ncbi:hypothetical protein RND81_02G026700 [Saponaria officinalis]|uniref:Uncharacterized protein n=1 Tax=Saponaria officinalis TaxID=3572 RepID=A0AAW1MPB4_SAPOF